MDNIRRIRPQSKRKAVRAALFCERYKNQLSDALDRSDQLAAEIAAHKLRYWHAKLDERTPQGLPHEWLDEL